MSRFIQLHLLTSYPPANLNRDDLGRPKTAIMGNTTRLRISSQSLKRAWRTSDVFMNHEKLKDLIGTRTRKIGEQIFAQLKTNGINEDLAKELLPLLLNEKIGALDSNPLTTKQAVHLSSFDELLIEESVVRLLNAYQEDGLAAQEKDPKKSKEARTKFFQEKLKDEIVLLKNHKNVDIALFGRMLTSSPSDNVDAACQVAHALSVHKVVLEDDFFTAVDDLNKTGSAYMDSIEFAAGLFYLYICIDKKLLLSNLNDDVDLTNETLKALVEAAATISPTGKQNSFASRARASYILAEKGDQQPRSLSVAFLKAISVNEYEDLLEKSIQSLTDTQAQMDKMYGKCADHTTEANAKAKNGSLQGIKDFITDSDQKP